MVMRLLAALSVALTIVAITAGCGASDAVDPAVVAKAADATTAAGAARLAMTAEIRGQTLHGQGVTDPRQKRAQVTLALPGGQGEIESRYIGGTMFLRLPESARQALPHGKEWAKIDMSRVLRSRGLDTSRVQTPSGSDPDQTLQALKGAGDVQRMGKEDVRGAATTHYKATIDMRKAAERMAAGDKAKARQGMSALIKSSGGRSTLPIEVWLDGQGRVRRMKLTQRIQGQDASYTMELYDFGTHHAVDAPSDDDTADITDQTLKQLGGG
jgi:hypothetical protein